ncbi:MAG: hypothetical protein JW832_07735 [Deltaproteobacteria bacterium]|nr:hypothetical protein [Deltaproteobacteria bacterium]
MAGARWINHKGKKVFCIDFSQSTVAEINATITQAKPLIAAEPPLSILCLVDTTGSKFDIEIAKALQAFSAHNKPYMKMTALVGVEGLQKVIYNGVLVFTKRTNIVLKSSPQEALDWLVSLA